MSDNWLCAVGMVLLAIVVSMPFGCTMFEARVIENAVKHGADPIDMRCALSPSHNQTVCAVRAAHKSSSTRREDQ